MNTRDNNTADWGKRESETSKAFAAFCLYRDMGASRSLESVSQKCAKSIPLLKRWSSAHEWTRRAIAYDVHLDQVRRAARVEVEKDSEVKAHLERVRKWSAEVQEASMLALRLAHRTLEAIESMPPGSISVGEAANLLRIASTCGEMALSSEAGALGLAETVLEV